MLSRTSMGRLMRGLNVLLACAVIGLAVLLTESLIEHQSLSAPTSLPGRDGKMERPQARAEEAPAAARAPLPSLSDFQIVVDRDPFRNPQEVVATVAVKPVPVSALPAIPMVPTPKPPLPPLSVMLSGIVAIGDEHKAILKDGMQEDLYMVGQAVAGGVLETIHDDRVVIVREGERTELLLKSAMERADPPSMVVAGDLARDSEPKATPSNRLTASFQEKRKKGYPLYAPMFSTPAFARYPGQNYTGGRQ